MVWPTSSTENILKTESLIMEYELDAYGNQISPRGKLLAALLLIPLICTSIVFIIALWPDRIPPANENMQSYCDIKLFHVRVISIPVAEIDRNNSNWLYTPQNSPTNTQKLCNLKAKQQTNSATINQDKEGDSVSNKSPKNEQQQKEATLKSNKKTDSTKRVVRTIEINKNYTETVGANTVLKKDLAKKGLLMNHNRFDSLVHLHILFLMMVVLGGFLGNLVYIAGSMTNFIGCGQFKRSWLLWYLAKPFIASGLALAVYFAFCGGFLTVNNNPNNINIFGVMILSVLAGLFSDRTTLKLREVFEVLLHPEQDRPDPLVGEPTVTSVSPLSIVRGIENSITIEGNNFEKGRLILTMGKDIIAPTISPKTIIFKYTVHQDLVNDNKIELTLKTIRGTMVFQKQLDIVNGALPQQ